MSLSGVLSPKEKARLAEVRARLAGGIPVYGDTTPLESGGSNLDRRRSISLPERSENLIHALESKWSAREEGVYRPKREPLDDVDMGLPLPEPPPPGEVNCTFCGITVDKINATFGKGKPRKIIKDKFIRLDGKLVWDQDVKHVTDHPVACPACVNCLTELSLPMSEG